MIDDDDCGASGGIKIGRGNRSTRRKPAPPRHFDHHKSHMTTPGLEPRAAAVWSQRLTAWAIARPGHSLTGHIHSLLILQIMYNKCVRKIILAFNRHITTRIHVNISQHLRAVVGTRQRSCSSDQATRRKVACSSPDDVHFFNLPNPRCRTTALRSTQL
jgi:hypothetical protein